MRDPSQGLTRKLLHEQSRYGSDVVNVAVAEGASFGISPSGSQEAGLARVGDDWLLVADLRLDNRDELRERVGRNAGRITDADLVLAAWIKGREAGLGWIAGDFALAMYDRKDRALVLARDISGELPLFYAAFEERAAFASMATGLRPFVGKITLDRRRLAQSAFFVGRTETESHFEHIKRVLPGEVVRIDRAGVHRADYWNPNTGSDIPREDRKRWIEGYRHVLDTAVAARIAYCESPIASHLSSGLDSSAVTATAARMLPPEQVIALTSAPAFDAPIPPTRHRLADESGIAAETAAIYGIRHLVVRNTLPIGEILRKQSLLCEEPILTGPNCAWAQQLRSEAAALGCSRLLSAVYGNTTLNYGGLYVLSEWVRGGDLGTWIKQAWYAAERPDTRWRGVLYNSFAPWIPAGATEFLFRTFVGLPPMDRICLLRPDWKAVAMSVPEHRYGRNILADRIHAMRENDTGALRKGWTAADGMDERDPLGDRRLIEFSLTIPPEQLYWNGIDRPLARAALADRLPRSVLDLRLRGLQGADWAQRMSQEEAASLLEEISASPAAQDLLDLAAMRQVIHRWPRHDWNRLWVSSQYRMGFFGALAVGMFALVHEQRESASSKVAPQYPAASPLPA